MHAPASTSSSSQGFQRPPPPIPPGCFPPVVTQQPMSVGQTPIGNCPPGLEYLTHIDQSLVHQELELSEITRGCVWNQEPIHPLQQTESEDIPRGRSFNLVLQILLWLPSDLWDENCWQPPKRRDPPRTPVQMWYLLLPLQAFTPPSLVASLMIGFIVHDLVQLTLQQQKPQLKTWFYSSKTFLDLRMYREERCWLLSGQHWWKDSCWRDNEEVGMASSIL